MNPNNLLIVTLSIKMSCYSILINYQFIWIYSKRIGIQKFKEKNRRQNRPNKLKK